MPPARIFKYLVIILISLVLLFASSVVLVYNFYPKDKALGLLVAGAEKALKRRITVGDLDYSLQGIIVHKVGIFEAPRGCEEIFVSADEAVLRFSFIKLIFQQKFDLNYIKLKNVFLNVCYRKDVSNLEEFLKDLESEGPSTLSAQIDTIALENARVSLKNPPPVLKPLEGDYGIDGTLDMSREKTISISDCTIVLPEKRGIVHPEMTLTIKDGTWVIRGDANLDKCSLLWVYKWGHNLTLPYVDVSAKVSNLKISRSSVEGSLKGVSTLSNKKHLFVSGYCKVGITDRTVFMSNARGTVQSSGFLVEEFLFDFGGSIKKFKIRNINAQLDDVMPILSFLPQQLYGSVNGNLSFENNRYSGSLAVNGGFDRVDGTIKNLSGNAVIRDNILERTPFSITLFDTPCDLTIASTDGNFKKFELNIRINEFAYSAEKKNSSPAAIKPLKLPVEVFGRIDIAALQIGQLPFSRISAGYSLSGSRLTVPEITGQFLGGDVKGKGGMDFSRGAPRVDVSLSFGNLKIQNLGKLSEKLKDRFFGVAAGNTELGFTIDENFNILSSLKGKLEFSIDRGKLVNTGIQNGLGIWLEELKYKLKDLEFNKIYGNIILAGDSYQINSFIFNAPDVRLKVNGNLNSDLAGDIHLDLEFTRNFIQDLPNPVLLRLSKYKRDRWYVIPFRSRGKDITDSNNLKRLD